MVELHRTIKALLLLMLLLCASGYSESSRLTPFKDDGKWGYVDDSGRVVIAPQYLQARKFSEGLAAVIVVSSSKIAFVDGRGLRTPALGAWHWGFVDETGAIVIDPQFIGAGDFSEGLAPVMDSTGKWGYIDKSAKMVIAPKFSRAEPFSEGLALVWSSGVHLHDPGVSDFIKMGYIDSKGQWVIRSRFHYYFSDNFSEGLVPFRRRNRKWGYMDKAGKTAIPPTFDWAGNFSGGIAPVVADHKCAHIDKAGRIRVQSATVIPHQKFVQDRHGRYYDNMHPPSCPLP